MNVLVIGAAGKTGQLVVKRALDAGHKVTAFVHDAKSYHAPSADVTVFSGDAADPAKLNPAMVGQAAVIDTIGGKLPFLHTDLERHVAKEVLAAMKLNGVKRLIAVSALGVGESKSQSSFYYEMFFLPLFLYGSTRDKAAMEKEIKESGVEFVLARPAILNDHEATGSILVFEGTAKAHKITRGDVAQFLVDQLEHDEFLGRAVTIANQ